MGLSELPCHTLSHQTFKILAVIVGFKAQKLENRCLVFLIAANWNLAVQQFPRLGQKRSGRLHTAGDRDLRHSNAGTHANSRAGPRRAATEQADWLGRGGGIRWQPPYWLEGAQALMAYLLALGVQPRSGIGRLPRSTSRE